MKMDRMLIWIEDTPLLDTQGYKQNINSAVIGPPELFV